MGRTLSLWTIGGSSFDAELDYSNGHVVHIAEPRFLARWTMKESHFYNNADAAKASYYDEDTGIFIYEITPLEADEGSDLEMRRCTSRRSRRCSAAGEAHRRTVLV
jgi:hypothetical protein